MKKSHKLKTGIDGLDKLFFGGIHIEMDDNSPNNTEQGKTGVNTSSKDGRNNPIIAIRGNRGVNKVYLEIPICRGLSDAFKKEKLQSNSCIISLSKTKERLESIYCNIYIQDIIHKIQTESVRKSISVYSDWLMTCDSFAFNRGDEKELSTFHNIVKSLITTNDKFDETEMCKAIQDGLIYYNERTRYFHVRRPKRNDDNDKTKILRIDAEKLAQKCNVTFVGIAELLKGREGSNNLVMFHELIHKLHEIKDHNGYTCIVIDGLSRLTDKDMEQCPFDAMVDLLHEKSHIGIISMDERLPVSKINPDIILDMRMRLDEKNNFTCRELCISKCLHQQNAYGWHTYKLRNYGIEIIPSIHKILYRRNYMDNAIPEALLSINNPSYRYWLEESIDNDKILDIDEREKENGVGNLLKNYYGLYLHEKDVSYDKIVQGSITAVIGNDKDERQVVHRVLSEIYNKLIDKDALQHHVLFIDFSRSKKDFWTLLQNDCFKKYHTLYGNIHFFRIRYGRISPDELLYTIERQVDALIKRIIDDCQEEIVRDGCLYKIYKYIHVVLGDMKYLKYGYPCLYNDDLFLPAYMDLTKGNYMQNYIYMSGKSEMLEEKIKLAADSIVSELQDNVGNSCPAPSPQEHIACEPS